MWLNSDVENMWTSRRELVTAVFLLENTAVISINDFWKLLWAKSYLGAIGRYFVWATADLVLWLPRPWVYSFSVYLMVHGNGEDDRKLWWWYNKTSMEYRQCDWFSLESLKSSGNTAISGVTFPEGTWYVNRRAVSHTVTLYSSPFC